MIRLLLIASLGLALQTKSFAADPKYQIAAFSENQQKQQREEQEEKEGEEKIEQGGQTLLMTVAKKPMSPTTKKIVFGILTFIVTAVLVFIVLALFNPPFVQKINKNEPEIYGSTPPADLSKALVYVGIGGCIAVGLPYAWKMIRNATNLPPNKVLDGEDDIRVESDAISVNPLSQGEKKHRRRRRKSHRTTAAEE